MLEPIALTVQICSHLMTMVAVLIAFQIYRTDRRQRMVERQAEVHRLATEQWRDLVKISIEHPVVRSYILRGMREDATIEHLFFELVALQMAYICLIETRQESTVAGASWISGWRVVLSDFLSDDKFRQFIDRMLPFYDETLRNWINGLQKSQNLK